MLPIQKLHISILKPTYGSIYIHIHILAIKQVYGLIKPKRKQ